MAQPSGKKKKPAGGATGAKPSTAKPATRQGIQPGGKAPRTAVQYGPAGSTMSKQAAGQPNKGNRNQLIIGGVAMLVITVVVVAGIMLNRSNTSVQNEGYGLSKSSTATISEGVVTLSAGAATKAIDLYEDPMCPACGLFEQQYGQQMAQAVDEGKLTINYHPLNFLDSLSASGNYSTRANAALMCTAEHLGSVKGLWSALHTTLFSEAVQPEENGSSDLTDSDLAVKITETATAAGVPAGDTDLTSATTCVTSAEMMETVTSAVATSNASLTALVGGVRSPVVVANGAPLNPNDADWLTDFLAG